jgi:hypothetical protein
VVLIASAFGTFRTCQVGLSMSAHFEDFEVSSLLPKFCDARFQSLIQGQKTNFQRLSCGYFIDCAAQQSLRRRWADLSVRGDPVHTFVIVSNAKLDIDVSALCCPFHRRANFWNVVDKHRFFPMVELLLILSKNGSDLRAPKLTERSVILSDGTELPADLVVYATGYGSMNGWAADLISKEVADKVGKVWGLGSNTTKDPGPWEGEQRNMWKPTQQEGLWFHGGNLHQSRHYSQFLSLQLKARMESIPTPVYDLQKVHHLG